MTAALAIATEGWRDRICAAWQASTAAIIETGRLLITAKAQLAHGDFLAMVENDLPFRPRSAQMLMAVAQDARLTNTKHVSLLPPSWGTLYELTKLPDDVFDAKLADGTINPEMQRKDVTVLRARAEPQVGQAVSRETCTIADLHEAVRQGRKFGCFYADPPWLYDNQGTRAATGNHYDGMTVEQLCAEIPMRELALPDAHLHLWTTNAFLFDCMKLFDAWGFEFRSTFVWCKPQMGIGNYWRNSHEILLTAIRGDAKRFNDHSIMSWLECDRGAHSAKPEQVRSFIERASTGPYLELFARRQADGWASWGNQIERNLFHREGRVMAVAMRWNCDLKGCFNKKHRAKFGAFDGCFPGAISLTDVDATVEINGYFLFLEFKAERYLPDGQKIYFRNLTRQRPKIKVIVVVGDAETMECSALSQIVNGLVGPWENTSLHELRDRLKKWADDAHSRRIREAA